MKTNVYPLNPSFSLVLLWLPDVAMKNPPQIQLHIQPMRQRAVVSNCKNPMPKLTQQLEQRSLQLMSSFREQQKLVNPAQIVPEKRNIYHYNH